MKREILPFSIHRAQELFQGPWDPQVIARLPGAEVSVAEFHGIYAEAPHTHEGDELFLVLRGEIRIITDARYPREEIRLRRLEGVVIPAGVKHQPSAEQPALVLMIDFTKTE